MCFRNCWYAAIFECHANNPKLKTDESVSRFEFNSSVKQLSRGESLLGSAQEKYGVWTGPRNCWFAALFEYHAKNPKLQGDKSCVTFRDK